MDEKSQLPFSPKPVRRWPFMLALGGLYLLSAWGPQLSHTITHQFHSNSAGNPDGLCPLVDKVDPSKYVYDFDQIHHILHDVSFKNQSLHKLQEAVRVPTQVYDDFINPNSADSLDELFKKEPRWKPFKQFAEYLEQTFPLVHKHLKVEKVNKLGLVFTWEGSEDKKPILLTAHYDVVPVQKETVPQWTYPPFDAHYDGEYLWGRGVGDCKNLLVGLMETVELLLSEKQFKPKRTIVLAFGYDEESVGSGADNISKHLLERYGPDSFYQLIDEGNSGFTEIEGNKYILPATGEKGHLDSILEIYTPGGHSSIPPPHTAIGLLSKIISDIEDREYASIITNSNPVLNQLQCVAEHSSSVDPKLRKTILKAHLDQNANAKLLDYLVQDIVTKYMVTTSQAADVIFGGVKANALPEHASVLINQRIAVEESVASTKEKIVGQVVEFAKKYDLGVVADGEVILEKTKKGYFNYTASQPLEPAPLTPVGDEIWDVFGGSLRYLYEDLLYPDSNDTFIFAPYISTGNTDTRFYWDLTRNIFRYEPGSSVAMDGIHSIDERIPFDDHLSVVAFYYYYLQVVDQLADPKDDLAKI